MPSRVLATASTMAVRRTYWARAAGAAATAREKTTRARRVRSFGMADDPFGNPAASERPVGFPSPPRGGFGFIEGNVNLHATTLTRKFLSCGGIFAPRMGASDARPRRPQPLPP